MEKDIWNCEDNMAVWNVKHALHKGTGDILDSGFVETIMDSWKDTSTKMVSPYVE